jgi:hypothetical protein
VHYTVAAALTDGAISLRHFGDAALARADLREMTARVKAFGVEGGESLSQACELTVKLKNGTTRSMRREDAEGRSADDYPRYMKDKFVDCVEQVYDRAYAEELLPHLTGFDGCTDVPAAMSRLALGSDGTMRSARS